MTTLKSLFGKKDTISEHTEVERCVCCGRIKVKGSRLEFMSQISRDGSTMDPIVGSTDFLDNTIFVLNPLSIKNGTYIASEMNSYVVKIKIN